MECRYVRLELYISATIHEKVIKSNCLRPVHLFFQHGFGFILRLKNHTNTYSMLIRACLRHQMACLSSIICSGLHEKIMEDSVLDCTGIGH